MTDTEMIRSDRYGDDTERKLRSEVIRRCYGVTDTEMLRNDRYGEDVL